MLYLVGRILKMTMSVKIIPKDFLEHFSKGIMREGLQVEIELD